ncbi:SAM-dependent methyltransferase [Pseudobacteriovorax antillogorgiicola]|uniref:Cyclopropane-fatty-acyl-phospholipid synthase n=1 Tax=Pseudobacteriovorax antillogorgiicola TaxID=1513793 RepID=A0A1Y6C9S4_9BACT|nr:cyclopropane-fatty-acyl-phospholipid synthase family protein [Pseudobacteriovorax antillogorgiicola]TCS48992.1 cyclopropane-fatty-acyl-phospholipid synthase [Pseudobacteriovorax antillogorgiicola]SMF53397.1 cyclopropane-fatty-acyl-phospholipid synthase [Pseudobacteriovorax antillogorgiicola]
MIASTIPSSFRKLEQKSLPFFVGLIKKNLGQMKRGRLIIRDAHGANYLELGEGDEVRATINVYRPSFYKRLVLGGDLGLAETYMEGLWETNSLEDVFKWFILNYDSSPTMSGTRAQSSSIVSSRKVIDRVRHNLNRNSRTGSKNNIQDHYDLGNKFFEIFLDPTMTYSCGDFSETQDLEQAQVKKFERLAKIGRMADGLKILEVGTGWGEFSCFLAEHFNCEVVTTTISDQQYHFAKKKIEERGLSHKITVLNCDYRDLSGQFDRIFTVEMLEAVGDQFLSEFCKQAHSWLKPQGLIAHQVILCPDNRYESFRTGVDFIQRHIFPGSLIPSLQTILERMNRNGDYLLLDLQDIGRHYPTTLRAWQSNFNQHATEVKALGFKDDFIRKWNYYFSYCAAAFAMKHITVAQFALTRANNPSIDR